MTYNKFKQLREDAGFLPDDDLYDFAEIVLEECFKVLDPSDVKLLKRHFGIPVIDLRCELTEVECFEEFCPVHGRDIR